MLFETHQLLLKGDLSKTYEDQDLCFGSGLPYGKAPAGNATITEGPPSVIVVTSQTQPHGGDQQSEAD